MDDKTLLELAAKAAGIKAQWREKARFEPWEEWSSGMVIRDLYGDETFWNPLEDDGDALRLGHKLRLFSDVEVWPTDIADFRRCIVRAAASIDQDAEREGM